MARNFNRKSSVVRLVAMTAALYQGYQSFAGPAVPSGRSLLVARRAEVETFTLDDGRKVRVFDGSYEEEICREVVATAKAAIASKGSFSMAIPSGSVVKALSKLSKDAVDYSKFHIFFTNDRVGGTKSYPDGVKLAKAIGIPESQVYAVGAGSPEVVAASYEALLRSHKSVDNSGPMPSVDMLLLGTGDDGHCGSLFPDTPEIKATGSGKAVLAITGDKEAAAVSMDFMRAAKKVIVSAGEKKRATMVNRALKKTFGKFDCPAGMVSAGETIWFTDTDSIAEYKA